MSGIVKRILPEEARKLIEEKDNIVLIDVRQTEEYEKGHIPGAISLPLPELPDNLMKLDPTEEIITYCRIGRRSFAAAQFIADEIGIDVSTMDGGVNAWNGLVAEGKEDEGLILTEGLKELKEFISLAYALEDGSRRFYLNMAEHFENQRLREIFMTLSQAEENHKRHILKAIKKEELPINEKFKDYMESGVPVKDMTDKIISEEKNIQEVLELSMQIEINALDLYMKISRMVEADTKEIFKNIIEEEKAHLKKLGDLLSKHHEQT